MRPPPLISVVLPVRDGAATLARAVASIRTQTFTDWELIIIDDGSTDESGRIAEGLAATDQRIRLIRGDGAGLVGALNAGLDAAQGALVARMDADDESAPPRLAEQAAFLGAEVNRGIGLVGCQVEFAGDRIGNAGYALHVDWLNTLISPEEIAANRFIESPFAHPSVMFRRELAARFGGYRQGDFPEDYDLWLRWLARGVRMAKVPQVLLRWHDSPERLSRSDPRYGPEAFFRLKAGHLAEWLRTRRAEIGSRKILVWGAGRPTRKRASHLEAHGIEISGYVDVDPRKFTGAIGGTGRSVVSYEDLPPPERAYVLGYVSSRGARDFIRAQLRARGYEEERDFMMCA